MKILMSFLFCMLMSVRSFGQVDSDDVTGVWLNDQKNAHVEIYKEGDVFFGKIVWIKEPGNREDESVESTELLGMVILSDLVYDNGKWKNGILYLPKKDREVNCDAVLSPDKEVLTLEISKLWFSTSIKWTRL